MKRKVLNYFTLIISVTMLFTVSLPLFAEASIKTEVGAKTEQSSDPLPANAQKLVNKYFTTTNEKNGDTDYAITDENLVALAKSQSTSKAQYNNYSVLSNQLKRSKGITHLHFYGKKRNGNFKVDVSKGILNTVRHMGVGTLVGFALLPLHILNFIAYVAVKNLLTDIIIAGTKAYKYGRKFYFSHFKYVRWTYQK